MQVEASGTKGAARHVTITFDVDSNRPGGVVFHDILVQLRTDDPQRLFGELQAAQSKRLGKPRWLKPSRRRPTIVGWSLKDEWGTSVRLEADPQDGKKGVELLTTSSVESDEED